MTALHAELMAQIERELIEQLDVRRNDVATLADRPLRCLVQEAAHMSLSRRGLQAGRERDALVERIADELVGMGPLEPLLSDAAVTEIMVNGPGDIYVERGGLIEPTGIAFSSEAALRRIIERIVVRAGRHVDEASPMVDARLADGSRVNVVLPPLAVRGPALTIRKFVRTRLDLAELTSRGALSAPMAQFLAAAIRARRNIVVSGGTGSGKTTLLNALAGEIPERERVVTVEDAAELALHHHHVVALESRPANLEGGGAIGIRELVRNALRMRPNRIIVGECRGGEALDMLQAMNTGHEGSLTTAHANSPRDLLARLEIMALMSGLDLPLPAVRAQVAGAVDLIVHQVRLAGGARRVASIVEVLGVDAGIVQLQELFRLYRGAGSDGGDWRHEACGQFPSCAAAFAAANEPLHREWFQSGLEEVLPWER